MRIFLIILMLMLTGCNSRMVYEEGMAGDSCRCEAQCDQRPNAPACQP